MIVKRLYRQEWLIPGWALTIKPFIFYYNPEYLVPDWLDAHEMEHMRQQQEEGLLRFIVKYTLYFLRGLLKTFSFKQAYSSIPYEKDARMASRRMTGD